MKAFPALLLFVLLLEGCGSKPQLTPSLGEAYAGPSELAVRREIDTKSEVIATVNHGDRVEILQRRRRFVKIRTSKTVEGWIEERLLLTPEQLLGLRSLSKQSKSAPSQGAATTYETLNVHTEPDRQSPSFLQVKVGEKVDVIGHRVTPRVSAPRPATPAPPPPAAKARPKKTTKEKKATAVPPPPMPVAPKPPADWLQLSTSTNLPPPPAPGAPEPKPVPMDHWSLIRNASGQSGWVLTRRLFMAIPDEVAQYAEGRRIVSYFSLGETRDGKDAKPTWLWTTVEGSGQAQDFDGFRVFVWSTRRHRYETAYIERNVRGFLPVITGPVPAPVSRSTKNAAPSVERVPGFSIVVEKQDGLRYRRHFAFLENRVRFSGDELVTAPPAPAPDPSLVANEKLTPPTQDSLYGSLKERIKRLLRR